MTKYRTFGTRRTPRLRVYWGIKPWHDRRNWSIYIGQPTEIFLGPVGLAIDWVPLSRTWSPSRKQRWMRAAIKRPVSTPEHVFGQDGCYRCGVSYWEWFEAPDDIKCRP